MYQSCQQLHFLDCTHAHTPLQWLQLISMCMSKLQCQLLKTQSSIMKHISHITNLYIQRISLYMVRRRIYCGVFKVITTIDGWHITETEKADRQLSYKHRIFHVYIHTNHLLEYLSWTNLFQFIRMK